MTGARTQAAVPSVVLSRRALIAAGVTFPQGAVEATLPIQENGTTYTMAQAAQFLDDSGHFAVGRWDGSLGVFSFQNSTSHGPLITSAAANPEAEGVQMITLLSPTTVATSSSDSEMTVWSADSGWEQLTPTNVIPFDPALGSANCGLVATIDDLQVLVVGHANGHLTAWVLPAFKQCMDVDLTHKPPFNPYDLFNIRGVQLVGSQDNGATVITGGEDGYLCLVEIPSGLILTSVPYDESAQRGINAVALSGRSLLVANCSVGDADSNLWLFEVDPNAPAITPCDHTNLRINPASPQVFNFATVFAGTGDGSWIASTEEGAIWMGSVGDGSTLTVWGYELLNSPPLGSAIALGTSGQIVVANYNLYEFTQTAAP